MEHYLDNSATTKVCPEAAQAALTAMTEIYGNPSSTHTVGREAKKLLDASRAQVASALDLSGRPYLIWNVAFPTAKIGT